jgi:hypothetical protein
VRQAQSHKQRKFKSSVIVAGLGTLALLAFLLIGCGGGDEKIDSSTYKDWKTYSYGKFTFHYPPGSVWTNKLDGFAQGYNRFVDEICKVLEMPVPEETIDFYIYDSDEHAEELTGRKTPFMTENAIHWSVSTPYAYQLTKFLLHKKGVEPSDFTVLNEGIAYLLDFSSINYHDKTIRIFNSDSLVTLEALGENDVFDTLSMKFKRPESASLCGFITYNYGIQRFLMLWESSVGWQRSIETIFQLPLDEFQTKWIAFASSQADDPEGTIEADSLHIQGIPIR